MRITQVEKPSYGVDSGKVGKWYCWDSRMGSDKYPVYRYLQADGTWGKNTHFFDTEADVREVLAKGFKPDFSMDRSELDDRQTIRDLTTPDWNCPWD